VKKMEDIKPAVMDDLSKLKKDPESKNLTAGIAFLQASVDALYRLFGAEPPPPFTAGQFNRVLGRDLLCIPELVVDEDYFPENFDDDRLLHDLLYLVETESATDWEAVFKQRLGERNLQVLDLILLELRETNPDAARSCTAIRNELAADLGESPLIVAE